MRWNLVWSKREGNRGGIQQRSGRSEWPAVCVTIQPISPCAAPYQQAICADFNKLPIQKNCQILIRQISSYSIRRYILHRELCEEGIHHSLYHAIPRHIEVGLGQRAESVPLKVQVSRVLMFMLLRPLSACKDVLQVRWANRSSRSVPWELVDFTFWKRRGWTWSGSKKSLLSSNIWLLSCWDQKTWL